MENVGEKDMVGHRFIIIWSISRYLLIAGILSVSLFPNTSIGQVYRNGIGIYVGKDVGMAYKRFFNETTSMQVQYGEMSDSSMSNQTTSMHISGFVQKNVYNTLSVFGSTSGYYTLYGVGLVYDKYYLSFTDPNHNQFLVTSHTEKYKKGDVFSIAVMLGVEFPMFCTGDPFAKKFLKHLSIGFEFVPQLALHKVASQDQFYITMNTHIRYVFGGMSKK